MDVTYQKSDGERNENMKPAVLTSQDIQLKIMANSSVSQANQDINVVSLSRVPAGQMFMLLKVRKKVHFCKRYLSKTKILLQYVFSGEVFSGCFNHFVGFGNFFHSQLSVSKVEFNDMMCVR